MANIIKTIIKQLVLLISNNFKPKVNNNLPEVNLNKLDSKIPETKEEVSVEQPKKYLVTREEILMGRDKLAPLDSEQEANLIKLLDAIQIIRTAYNKPLFVSSGYRPAAINASVGGAKRSAHMSCEAVDFKDSDGSLAKWCLSNLDLIKKAGLYLENPSFTITKDKDGNRIGGWVHLQTRPTRNNPFNP